MMMTTRLPAGITKENYLPFWSLLMILLHDQLTIGVIENMLDYEEAFSV